MTAHRKQPAKPKKGPEIVEVSANEAARMIAKIAWKRDLNKLPETTRKRIILYARILETKGLVYRITSAARSTVSNPLAFVDTSPMEHQQATGKAELQSSDRFVKGQSLTENVRESMLAWCYSRKKLTNRQFDAGRRLYADYVKSGREIPGAPPMDQDKVDKSGQRGATDAMLEAASRFDRSMKQCQHEDMRNAVFAMAVLDENSEAIAKQINVHPKAVMSIVRMGLDLVARSYDAYAGAG